MIEEWRPVVGWEGSYEVSNHGRVRSLARIIVKRNGPRMSIRERILKPALTRGYECVTFSVQDERRYVGFQVHRAVAIAFLPNPGNLPVVAHLDGGRRNNHISNLRWSTYRENEADKVRHGTRHLGERVHTAKLDAEKVRQIRSDPRSARRVAADLGVCKTAILNVRAARTWKHVLQIREAA